MQKRTLINDAFAQELRHLRYFGGGDGGDNLAGMEDILGKLTCISAGATYCQHAVVSEVYLVEISRDSHLQPDETKTVLPSRELLYCLSDCSAVTATSGIDAASIKVIVFGFKAT